MSTVAVNKEPTFRYHPRLPPKRSWSVAANMKLNIDKSYLASLNETLICTEILLLINEASRLKELSTHLSLFDSSLFPR